MLLIRADGTAPEPLHCLRVSHGDSIGSRAISASTDAAVQPHDARTRRSHPRRRGRQRTSRHAASVRQPTSLNTGAASWPRSQRRIKRVCRRQVLDPNACFIVVAVARQGARDEVGDLDEVIAAKTPGGQCRRSDPKSRRHHGRARVVRHRVAVDRDSDTVQRVLRRAAG